MTGYDSKRKMAADKFIAAEERKVGERYGYVPKLHPSEWMNAQPAQEPINLLEARKIAAEYGTPDSQIDSGNLYFALSKCLEHIDAQPMQEPVGTLNISRYKGHLVNHDFDYFGELPDGTYSVYTNPILLPVQPDHIPDAGKMVQPAQRQPLTVYQRIAISEQCVNLKFDDDFLNDICKVIILVEAAHGIGKI